VTIAVVWREENALYAAADTRFSSPGATTVTQRVTDHGPKLFSLPVIIRQPDAAGFFDSIRYQTTIGYMYAGQIGPALATQALCATVLQNLIVIPHLPIPKLSEIVEFIRMAAERYMRNWAELNPRFARFEAILFGWCCIEGELQAYQFAPKVEDRLNVKTQRLDLSEPVAIGVGTTAFTQRLESLRADGDPFGRSRRLPLLAVESLVLTEARDDVGGDVQIGYVTSHGLRIMARTRPIVPGKPQAKTTFLGIDTEELGHIGSCEFGMMSLA
jgi:hypothetical protein